MFIIQLIVIIIFNLYYMKAKNKISVKSNCFVILERKQKIRNFNRNTIIVQLFINTDCKL